MKFTSFKIKNFRGVPDAEIVVKDDRKPICLLGLNESGKTTKVNTAHGFLVIALESPDEPLDVCLGQIGINRNQKPSLV